MVLAKTSFLIYKIMHYKLSHIVDAMMCCSDLPLKTKAVISMQEVLVADSSQLSSFLGTALSQFLSQNPHQTTGPIGWWKDIKVQSPFASICNSSEGHSSSKAPHWVSWGLCCNCIHSSTSPSAHSYFPHSLTGINYIMGTPPSTFHTQISTSESDFWKPEQRYLICFLSVKTTVYLKYSICYIMNTQYLVFSSLLHCFDLFFFHSCKDTQPRTSHRRQCLSFHLITTPFCTQIIIHILGKPFILWWRSPKVLSSWVTCSYFCFRKITLPRCGGITHL